MNRTLYNKLVDAHKVCDLPDGDMLIYVDFHIMNEYTSPQAFSGLDAKRLGVWRPKAHLAVIDHVNATRSKEPHDAASKVLIDNLEANCIKTRHSVLRSWRPATGHRTRRCSGTGAGCSGHADRLR